MCVFGICVCLCVCVIFGLCAMCTHGGQKIALCSPFLLPPLGGFQESISGCQAFKENILYPMSHLAGPQTYQHIEENAEIMECI